jgi:hypothetical protein
VGCRLSLLRLIGFVIHFAAVGSNEGLDRLPFGYIREYSVPENYFPLFRQTLRVDHVSSCAEQRRFAFRVEEHSQPASLSDLYWLVFGATRSKQEAILTRQVERTVFPSLVVWLLLTTAAGSAWAADRNETIIVDAKKQLFLDDFLIASARNVKRIVHPAHKYADNPVLDSGFLYGSVIREDSTYRMWYFARPGVGYAESPDGVHWTRPEFGLVKIDGKKTNLVLGRKHGDGNRRDLPPQDTLDTANLITAKDNRELPAAERGEVALPYFYEPYGVHRDDGDPDPARRYKMGFNDVDFRHTGEGGDPFHKGQRRGVGVAASPDGIHWRLVDNWATESICDGGTHWMFDPERRKYILYGRTKFLPPAEVSAWGIHGLPTLRMDPSLHVWLQAHFWGRAVARVESSDFVHWNITEPAKAPIVMTTDLQDQPGDEAYDMEVFPYEGVYIGLLRIYHNLPDDPTLDIQLTVSRDTYNFTRVGDRSPFLTSGAIGSWDRFNQSIPTNSPIPVGDELRFYYSGSTGRHFPYAGKDTAGQEAIGFATVLKDRFVSLAASFDGGEILSRPVKLTGRTLHINAKSNFGEILIEILAGGQTIATSKPVRRDALDIPVEWNVPTTLERTKGPVVLRITLKNAHLFALWSV